MAVEPKKEHQQAVDRNFAAFKKMLPGLLKEHAGRYALLRDEELVQMFDSARDAMLYGNTQYSDGLFSVQEITEKAVDLGFFSHALHYNSV